MVNFMKMGVPLDDNTLAQMSKGERDFWSGFLHQANQEIAKCENKRSPHPFKPSSSLKKKYFHAIRDLDGAKYCQVRQLKMIFHFQ